MPFTDKDLDAALTTLDSKMRVLNDKQQELRQIERNFLNIKKTKREIPLESGEGFETVEDEPMDQGTNKAMTASRKSEVYTESKRRLDAVTV